MGIRRSQRRVPFAAVSESAEFSATTTGQRRRQRPNFSVGQNELIDKASEPPFRSTQRCALRMLAFELRLASSPTLVAPVNNRAAHSAGSVHW